MARELRKISTPQTPGRTRFWNLNQRFEVAAIAVTGISATTIPAVIAGGYFYPVPRSNGPALFLPLLHFEESRHPGTPGLPESIKRLDDDLMNPRSR
jgi:hypothetical protein